VDVERAGALREAWFSAHHEGEAPPPDAGHAVERALVARVPDPDAAAVVPGDDGRPLVAVLAGRALFLVWAVGATAAVPDAVRCRRIPLAPETVIEVSERVDDERAVRHWWFELDEDPLVFRTIGEDDAERFARALAAALGWGEIG
jgi:hypothetical protein